MKTFILSAGLFLFAFSTQAQQITEQISFSMNDVETSQFNGFDVVRPANTSILEDGEYVGKPQLRKANPSNLRFVEYF
ncbi:MAG TPA: hypothetical protein VFM82_03930 [Flavobacteriaceae bacterium]|nr:hypothetical protein [Flavobacteriaceae bacterium]